MNWNINVRLGSKVEKTILNKKYINLHSKDDLTMWALPSTMSFQVSNMYLLGMFHGWPLAQHIDR